MTLDPEASPDPEERPKKNGRNGKFRIVIGGTSIVIGLPIIIAVGHWLITTLGAASTVIKDRAAENANTQIRIELIDQKDH